MISNAPPQSGSPRQFSWKLHPTPWLSCLLFLALFFFSGCRQDKAKPSPGDVTDSISRLWLSPPIGEALCMAGVPRGGDLQERAVLRLAELGVHRVRMDLLWHDIEKEKGVFDFSITESMVRPYLDKGVEVLGLLCYGVPWASSATEDDPTYPPDDPADFANYVSRTLEYFGSDIQVYEIWNEPNAGFRFWKPGFDGDPEAYGALLKAAVTAGRKSCPSCIFLFGSPFFHTQLVSGHIPFLREAQNAHPDLAEFYDAMGFHPYPSYPPQAAPEGPPPEYEWAFSDMVAGVKEVLAEQGAEEKPLWSTEIGWPVFGPVDENLQAAYLVRGLLHLLALGTAPVCWYNLFEGEKPRSFPPEDAFGLLTHGDPDAGVDPEPKPAFFALRQLGNRFASFRIAGDLRQELSMPAHAYGYSLEDPEGVQWWVLWQFASETALEITLPNPPLEVRSMTGEEINLTTPTLQLSEHPVFLRISSTPVKP